jgi:hypothetical protein
MECFSGAGTSLEFSSRSNASRGRPRGLKDGYLDEKSFADSRIVGAPAYSFRRSVCPIRQRNYPWSSHRPVWGHRARVSRKLTFFGFYMLNQAKSNTDGAGSFPANQYDMSTEYGSAAFDVRHRVFIGGSIEGPYGFRVSPLVAANSRRPFDIVVGRDLNGDSLFNDRPAFAHAFDDLALLVRNPVKLVHQIINLGVGGGDFALHALQF